MKTSLGESAPEKLYQTASFFPCVLSLSSSFRLTTIWKLKVVLRSLSILAALLVGLCQVSLGQDYDIEVSGQPPSVPVPKGVTLFQNVRIFDGTSPTLSAPSNVLIRGNTIERISASPITVDPNANVQVLAGTGRVLMSRLIDAHSFIAATPQPVLMTSEAFYLHLLDARQAEATRMSGFTTVRDLGGSVFGLKRAIDEGVMVGPRIYPSGAMITQTSGHGDLRFLFELPRKSTHLGTQIPMEALSAGADSVYRDN
jgi:imidazolonepropionase-like amidohydrolase